MLSNYIDHYFLLDRINLPVSGRQLRNNTSYFTVKCKKSDFNDRLVIDRMSNLANKNSEWFDVSPYFKI